MFENPRRDRQARNFTTNVPKILDFKSFSEQIIRKLTLGAPEKPAYGAYSSLLKTTHPSEEWQGRGYIIFKNSILRRAVH